MTELRQLFMYIAGLLTVACSLDIAMEEGRKDYLACGSSSFKEHITQQLLQNGVYVNVSTCSVQGRCQDFTPTMFTSQLITDDNNGAINELCVRRVSKDQNTFRCIIDNEIAGIFNAEIFVAPVKPTCSNPALSEDRSKLILTCRTETVYPSALCTFRHRGDLAPEIIDKGVISYTTSPSTVSPGNKATECTLTVPASWLPRKLYQFQVLMIPDVRDRTKVFSTQSEYTCPFVTVNPDKPTCSAPIFSGDKNYVIVNCRTAQVYPRGRCKFTAGETAQILDGEIHYQESISPLNPGNTATNCTILIPRSILSGDSYKFQVHMFPDIYSEVKNQNITFFKSDLTPAFLI